MCPNCRVRDYSGNPRASIHLWKSDSEFSRLNSLRAWILGEVDTVRLLRAATFIPVSLRTNLKCLLGGSHTCAKVKTRWDNVPFVTGSTAIMILASLPFLRRRQSARIRINRLWTRKTSFPSADIAITRRVNSFSSFSLGIRKSYDISGVRDSENTNDEVSIARTSCNTTRDATSCRHTFEEPTGSATS